MGTFEDYKRFYMRGTGGGQMAANPLVQCEIQEPVERMVEAWKKVDEVAHSFLERVVKDEMFLGLFEPGKEWDCWLTLDKKHSCLFFDETLEVFGDTEYAHFMKVYGREWKEIGKSLAEIEKMGRALDEYAIFKSTLYNVFNNKNMLPLREYLEQVYDRAKQYGMVLAPSGRGEMDFLVQLNPLAEVNRGFPFYSYELRMGFNPNYRQDGYVYSVQKMDARTASFVYAGMVDLPVLGSFGKFEERVNDCFLNSEPSPFMHDAVRAKRSEEKKKYHIPAYYFEATFLDASKLVNFSKKSYQYGHSSVFIPKSQVAWAGDKLYVNRWLFYRLKDEVLSLGGAIGKEAKAPQAKAQENVDELVANAKERTGGTPARVQEKEVGKD